MDDEMDMNDEQLDSETIILKDEAGRAIACSVERFLEVEEQEYALLVPLDAPVEIFAWQGENDDDEEAVPVSDENEIDLLFPIAKAVLEEQNLTLKRTAVVLTVEGNLPDLSDDDDYAEVASDDGDEELEELQYLASFYFEEREFAVYAPLDPCFILVRMNEQNEPQLLSPEELEKLEPMLEMIEDELFDEFESA
jgi:Protein of unknown function (DUF3727)/Protein of unknown function (DUF1292)